MERREPAGIADHRTRKGVPTQEVADIHQEFLRAIESELDAVREADIREAVRLPEGRLVAFDGLVSRFLFDLNSAVPRWMLHGRGILQLQGQPPVSLGLRARGRHVGLEFVEDHDPPSIIPAGARIWPDRAWMLRGLLERLDLIEIARATKGETTPPFHSHIALAAIGECDAGTSSVPVSSLPTIPFGLDPDQMQAVLFSQSSSVHWLWGAPGSGKSRTVAHACILHFRSSRSLLISGPTHASVDLILQQVCDGLADEVDLAAGDVIRLGSRATDHLAPEYADAVLYDRVLARRRAELEAAIQHIEAELQQLTRPPVAKSDGEGRSQEDHRASLVSRVVDLKHQLADLPWSLLRDARIIAGTMWGVVLSRRLRRDYEAVALDEVSMAPVPLVYAVAGLAETHLLLAGDHLQLPVPVASADPSAVRTLATDVFRRAGFAGDIDRGIRPEGLSILRGQYRLPPAVCDIVSRVFYGGLLQPRGVHRPSGAGVVLVDTSAIRPRVQGVARSRSNTVHGALVARIVARIRTKRQEETGATPRVRVVTPYRAQARLISERLRHEGDLEFASVSTVHRGQGSEADLILLDLPDAPGLPPGPFLLGESIHETGPRLVNVAMTRVREHLIIVADVTYISRHGGRTVRDILRRVMEIGRVVDARDILGRESRS